MATTLLPPDRALPRPRRTDLRAILGIFVMVVAMLGTAVVWSQATDTQPVLIATRNLPSGKILTTADLAVAHLHADATVADEALPASIEDQIVGKALAGPAYAHQMLVRAQISTRPPLRPGELAFSIPVSSDTAASALIQIGDTVRVYVTTTKATPAARTSVVVEQATVLDVGGDRQSGSIGIAPANDGGVGADATSSIRSLTLEVTPQQAQALAFARWNGELDIALLPPTSDAEQDGTP